VKKACKLLYRVMQALVIIYAWGTGGVLANRFLLPLNNNNLLFVIAG
jgi:hypothetical protein